MQKDKSPAKALPPLLPQATLRMVERVSHSRSLEEAGSVALRWLAQSTGIRKALCLVVDMQAQALATLACAGVSQKAAKDFEVSLHDAHHPLVTALSEHRPFLLRSPAKGRARYPETPLDANTIVAVPLRNESSGDEVAFGLLLLGDIRKPPKQHVQWCAYALMQRMLVERHRAACLQERRLGREREMLQDVLNAVSDPVLLTDANGRILVANTQAENLFFADELATEGRRQAVALNNMMFSAAAFTTYGHQKAAVRELLLADPVLGNDLFYELLTHTIAGVGVVCILRNVEDLREATRETLENFQKMRAAEAYARAERDRLDLILNSVADPVLMADAAGKIIRTNLPADKLFAVRPELDTEESRRWIRTNDAVLSSFVSNFHTEASNTLRGELNLIDPANGKPMPVEAIGGRVRSSPGYTSGVVVTLHDRREALEKARLYEQVRRHSEELKDKVAAATHELMRQNERLRRQALQLEQASTLKSQFLANMSHELRTPLNAIVGYTDLLLKGVSGPLADRQRHKLERICSNADQLLSLINDLLDISRIEAGKMPVHCEWFSVHDLIKEIMSDFEPLIARSGLDVRSHVASSLPRLYSDRQKVKQVVLNLFSNALKFTSQGSVIVAVDAYDEENVAVSIEDTGVGIAAHLQDSIFEDFQQADNSYTRQYGGSGLGLSICRRLAEMLGGSIMLESAEGRGSKFTLRVPLHCDAVTEPLAQEVSS